MPEYEGLTKPFQPNWEGLVANIRMEGTPDRVYHFELFHDKEVEDAIIERFDLEDGLDPNDPDYGRRRHLTFLRFIGFDFVRVAMAGQSWPFHNEQTDDTAALSRGRRNFRDEHRGPITNWEEFESYPWPDPNDPEATRDLEWWQEHVPDDMCLCTVGGQFCEYLTWLMGYETLCFALYDNRELVRAVADRIYDYYETLNRRYAEFDRVRLFYPSDDMGFKSGTMISPDDIREFVLPGHKMSARIAHEADCPCVLHSCGNLHEVIDDLIDDCGIDGKHSFEDTIEDVRDLRRNGYGRRIALLGGIDVDFVCRADEDAIRRRTRDTLDVCQPGGGYCLGTGNSVANYIPLDHYLAMVDEGRLYGG
ncbi:MAG: uroporphyrinogen decarboxylase family protein [Planctomycetota bacterium]